MFNFNFFRTEVAKVTQQLGEMRAELERKLRRREELQRAPLAKEDLLAMLETWVDAEASKYPDALRKALQFIIRNPGQALGSESCPGVGLLTATFHVGEVGSPEHLQKNLFFYFRDQFKAGFRKAVAEMKIDGAGPTLAERARELAQLDTQIAELQDTLDLVAREAVASGISIANVRLDPRDKRTGGR